MVGRHARVPEAFFVANVTDYVQVKAHKKDFYAYQQTMPQCHVLIPLIHPSDEVYFLGPGLHQQGRLSGVISQTIGSKIPVLAHTRVVDNYKEHFTALVFAYEDTQESFNVAFQKAIGYWRNRSAHESEG